jgi:hypothetical protein
VKLRDVTIARTKIMPCGNLGSVSKTCTGVCKCCRKTVRLVGAKDAAKYLGITPRQIHEFVLDGRLTAIKGLTKRSKFDTLDLDSLIVRAKEVSKNEDKVFERYAEERRRR